MSIALPLLLLLYEFITVCIGYTIVGKIFQKEPLFFHVTASFVVGTIICVPYSYLMSLLFSWTNMPMVYGVLAVLPLGLLVRQCMPGGVKEKTVHTHSHVDFMAVCFSLAISTWVMMKTFRTNSFGEIFVGSNNVFDFGLLVGLVRSFSWGSNIPFQSPFFSGGMMLYHFMFSFWAGQLEYFGMPLIFAINIPSILTFASLLMLIYYTPQIIFHTKNRYIGWIALVLTLTNSSMTFLNLLVKNGVSLTTFKSWWIMPTYPFAGPFDGSTISIFVTLNSFVNQRHLAISLSIGLIAFLMAIHVINNKKIPRITVALLGIIVGCSILWNMVTAVCVIGLIALLFILFKQNKPAITFSLVIAACSIGVYWLFHIPFPVIVQFLRVLTAPTVAQGAKTVSPGMYLWQNLGVLPFFVVYGYYNLDEKTKKLFMPYLVLFIVLIISVFIAHGFNQKLYSYAIIGANMLAAFAVVRLFQQGKLSKVLAVLGFIFLTVSGVVDLIPIKNEFAYPFITKNMMPAMRWIRGNTPKNSVFVSYSDMIDPVVLSGRNNFFGFFGNVGWYDRSGVISKIVAGDQKNIESANISYIFIQKGKNEIFESSPSSELAKRSIQVYKDSEIDILSIRR